MDCNLKKLEKSLKKTDYRLFFSGEITSSRDSESNLILDKGYLVKYLSTKDKHKTNLHGIAPLRVTLAEKLLQTQGALISSPFMYVQTLLVVFYGI